MKIPTTSKSLAYGLMYGIASQDHTFYYDGWDRNSLAKYKRIVTSRFCEQWIAEFCRINKIPFTADDSHFTQNDEFDIIINGWKFDIKSSTKSEYMQVNAALQGNDVDGYLFCKTNEEMSMIEMVGIINKATFWEKSKSMAAHWIKMSGLWVKDAGQTGLKIDVNQIAIFWIKCPVEDRLSFSPRTSILLTSIAKLWNWPE